MLAEIYMLRWEAEARAAREAPAFVPPSPMRTDIDQVGTVRQRPAGTVSDA